MVVLTRGEVVIRGASWATPGLKIESSQIDLHRTLRVVDRLVWVESCSTDGCHVLRSSAEDLLANILLSLV